MPNDKQVIERIAALKDGAAKATGELARHEAAAEQAGNRVAEIETYLVDMGFDPAKDLTQQLAKASEKVEKELAAIGVELEALR